MEQKLVNLITLDFRQFKFSRIKNGLFNELSMMDGQFYGLEQFLSVVKEDIDKLINCTEPDASDMKMMDVKLREVGYREIGIENIKFDEDYKPKDWKYKLSYCIYNKENDDNPGMRFGDRLYSRDEVKLLGEKG